MFSRIVLLLAILWPALSIAGPLAFEDAVLLAQESQPLLNGRQAAVRADEERAVAEAQLPDPRLKLGLINVPYAPFSLSSEPMTQTMVSVEQTFPGGDKRRLRSEVAQASAAQKTAEIGETARMIRREAGLAWLDAWYPQHALTRIQALQQEYRYQIEAERIRLATGKGEQKDVLAAQVQLDLLQDRGSEFEAQSAKAHVALVRWIGADAAKRELAKTLPALTIQPDAQQLAAHPQIATIDKSIAVLERETALAREALKSDWSMELGYGARGAGQDDMLSVQVGFDLQVAPAKRQDRQIAAKLEELDALQAQREDRLRTLQASLQSALAEKQSLETRIARYQSDILPVSKQRTEATLVSYRNGKAEFSSVLEARRAELDMGLQLLALQAALARSEVELAYFAPEGVQL
jgi:outer membrane protein, heavy metal efflux system